jgi:hypothetical protein
MEYNYCRKCSKKGVYTQGESKVCRYCGNVEKVDKWTEFWDMHSGGSQKEDFARCYIQAPEEEACRIFYARFGHNPLRVTCTCCGEDYSISESDSLEEATAYPRDCRYAQRQEEDKAGPYKGRKRYYGFYLEPGEDPPEGFTIDEGFYRGDPIPLKEYLKEPDVHVIRVKDIKPHERTGRVPEQGYVWVG